MQNPVVPTPQLDIRPVELFSDEEWAIYRTALESIIERGVPFALGGGFAFSLYSRRWRDTKDIDVYVLPEHRDTLVDLLAQNGFEDYHSQLGYDRKWIYRGYRCGLIVDVIWAMANQRATTDLHWLTAGPRVRVHDLEFHVLPAEELLWTKLYVLQRDRSDWPDLLSILQVQGPSLNWRHLLDRVGDDARVLGGLLNVFVWLCPARARELPEWLWGQVGILPPPPNGAKCGSDSRRVALLDSRDWFGPREGK